MKKSIHKSFFLIICGVLFFASHAIHANDTLAIVAKMPSQIKQEIKGTGATSGKGSGAATHIKNIIHGNKKFGQKFFTIEAEKTPHITLAIIGTLNHNKKKVTDTAGKTFKVKDIGRAVERAINDYILYQKRQVYKVPLLLKLNKGAELLYEGKPNITVGATKVSVVQEVLGQQGVTTSGKLAYLADKLRTELGRLGVTFRYGFKPHVTLATVSSSQIGIQNLKKDEINSRSKLSKDFGNIASMTEKANKSGYKYRSMKIDEILLSFDRNMKNTIGYKLR